MSKSNPFALDFSTEPPKDSREALERCSALFPVDDLEWKVQTADKNGKPPKWAQLVCYVSARAAQSRLDEVFGLGWFATYEETEDGIRCHITVTMPEGGQVTRCDVVHWEEDKGPNAPKMAYKATHSLAFKRAAVQFGVGRYLYALKATWADKVVPGNEKRSLRYPVILSGGKYPNNYAAGFDPMKGLPDWAIPERAMRTPPAPREAAPVQSEEDARRERLGFDDKGHTLWFRTSGRAWTGAQLGGVKVKMDDVSAWSESLGRPRLSGMEEARVRNLVALLITPDSDVRRAFDAWLAKGSAS